MDLRLVPIKAQERRSREGSEEVGTTFVIHSAKKGLEGGNARCGQTARGFEADFAGEVRQVASQGGDRIGKRDKAGIAADFADSAQDADCSKLLEDIGIAQNGGFNAGGFIVRLMLADHLEDRGDFIFGKARIAQDGGRMRTGIGDVVPAAEFLRIFGAVADEDAQIVEPGSRSYDVPVVVKAGSDQLGEAIETGLMAEFIDGKGLFPNEVVQVLKVIHRHELFVSRQGLHRKMVTECPKSNRFSAEGN